MTESHASGKGDPLQAGALAQSQPMRDVKMPSAAVRLSGLQLEFDRISPQDSPNSKPSSPVKMRTPSAPRSCDASPHPSRPCSTSPGFKHAHASVTRNISPNTNRHHTPQASSTSKGHVTQPASCKVSTRSPIHPPASPAPKSDMTSSPSTLGPLAKLTPSMSPKTSATPKTGSSSLPQSLSAPSDMRLPAPILDARHSHGRGGLFSFLGGQMGSDVLGGKVADSLRARDSLGSEDAVRRREGIYNFFQVPRNLEPLLLFGFLACVDSFIDQFTFLPLRVFFALAHRLDRKTRSFSPAQSRDGLRVLLIILVSCSLLMLPGIKMSQAYHNVRNQSVMKLYVVFSVLEIFDKLCASFGQDILESLFASASSVRSGSRSAMWLDLLVAYGYLTAHTLVLFYQVVALSVAINSNSNVLLTLLISNNFTELKTSVFKRCEPENLFQIACSDSVERFTICMYLLIVLVQFVFVQKEELTTSRLQDFAKSLAMICGCELLVDWIKHAFVTKFNRLRPDVYAKFIRILCADTAASAASQEPLSAVSSRMGFVPLPLFCLVVRVIWNDVLPVLELQHSSGPLLLILSWLVFCGLKLLTSMSVLGFAILQVERNGGPAVSQEESKEMRLRAVARYTLVGKQIM